MKHLLERIHHYLGLVRFAHTVFALPFAIIATLVAAGGLPDWWTLGWILFCMVTARTSAMSFNRIADLHYDRLNPRTRSRHLPAGMVSVGEAVGLWLLSSGLFVVGAAQLNSLTLALSPVALLIIWAYSYMKRFTSLCHLVLGLSLAIAPIGAWVAITGEIGLPALVLGAGVLLWVTGFDIIYALLDEAFDREAGLHSMVVRLGRVNALRLSFALHLASVGFFWGFGYMTGLGWIYGLGVGAYAALIIYEHSLVRPDDVSQVNTAFFTVNGVISIGLMVICCLDVFLPL